MLLKMFKLKFYIYKKMFKQKLKKSNEGKKCHKKVTVSENLYIYVFIILFPNVNFYPYFSGEFYVKMIFFC